MDVCRTYVHSTIGGLRCLAVVGDRPAGSNHASRDRASAAGSFSVRRDGFRGGGRERGIERPYPLSHFNVHITLRVLISNEL